MPSCWMPTRPAVRWMSRPAAAGSQARAAPEQHADIALEISNQLSPAIDQRGLRKLYDEIELPLTRVLARMSARSTHRSRRAARLSGLMETEIARLTAEVTRLPASRSTSARRRQLGKILFRRPQAPAPVKYGKGKTISTAADVLDELAPEHEIVRKVLEYRQLTKAQGQPTWTRCRC